jgi:hypothetical protein
MIIFDAITQVEPAPREVITLRLDERVRASARLAAAENRQAAAAAC